MNAPDAPPIASSSSVPRRYPESVVGTVTAAGSRRRRSGSSLTSTSSISSLATLGGDRTPSTVASGATYRSLIHLASSSIDSSKNRTGETRRITGSTRPLAVEPDTDVGPETGAELGRERVREGPVERKDRSVDADRDRTRDDLRRRRRSGARPRDRWPPRGTPCARSARRPPSLDRWGEPDRGHG